MEICFRASESVSIPVKEQEVPIQHYLRQPHRIVKAIAEPKLMDQLSNTRYRLKMRPLNFMEMYHFQPTVILKVWTYGEGKVYLKSESCQIRGIDYINDRFTLSLQGKLIPETNNQNQTYLKGKADLEVRVELPPPLWLTPKPLLEVTGNGLLKSVLLRIKQKLVSQLVKDYYNWVSNEEDKNLPSPVGKTAENPIS